MPTYDYFCSHCGKTEEIFHKISDDPKTNCPHCHQEALIRRPAGGIGLSFSGGGDGFYKNMYGQNKVSEPSGSSSAGGCCPCGKGKGACSSS
jgi:putative FmdB family regulatory protein